MITNKVFFIGRLTKDCEYEVRPSGMPVAKIKLAVERTYKKDNEKITDFFQLKAFKQKADFIANYISKGTLIAVEASLRNDNYEKDGNTVYRDSIIIDEVKILAHPASTSSNQPQQQTNQQQYQPNSQSQFGSYGGQQSYGNQQPYTQPNYGGQTNGGMNQQYQTPSYNQFQQPAGISVYSDDHPF